MGYIMGKNNIVMSIFRQRLALLRRERGLSQKQAGMELGMPQQTYNSYESGPSVVTLPIAQKMAAFFGVTTDYLAGLSDDKDPRSAEQLCEKLGAAAKEALRLLDGLNDTGRSEALKRLSELALVPVYTEPESAKGGASKISAKSSKPRNPSQDDRKAGKAGE